MEASSDYQASWKDLLAGNAPGLVANLTLEAKNYAIDRIPVLSSRELAGRLDGRIELTGLGRDAKLDGALELRKLQVARVPVDSASVRVKFGDGELESTVTVKHPGGHLDAALSTGLVWKQNLVPKLPDDGELELQAKAKNFRLGTLLPLVSGSVAKLDGRIDADLSARLGKNKQILEGHAELREGLVQVPAIGQELRDIRARVELEPNGAIYLRDAFARGVTGRVRVAAAARLAGLRLAAFRAVARIDEREPIPLTVEGVSLGNMWGTTTIAGRSTPEKGAQSAGGSGRRLRSSPGLRDHHRGGRPRADPELDRHRPRERRERRAHAS